MPVFTNALPTFFFSSSSFGCLTPCVFPSIVFVANLRSGGKSCQKFFPLNLAATRERSCISVLLSSKGVYWGCSGIVRRCKGSESEGDFALEAEILEFMKNSKNPEAFPSQKELVDAGRTDLVEAIVKKGGWLSLGWNLDEEEDVGDRGNSLEVWESELAVDSESFGEYNSESDEIRRFVEAASPPSHSSSFTGRSLEIVAENESGIEGMLSRLEKERNATFGVGFPSSVGKNDTSAKEAAVDLQGTTTSISVEEGKWNKRGVNISQNSSTGGINGLRDSVSPEVRRTWSTYRRELQDGDSEAFEIASGKGRSREALDVSNSGQEEINHSQIRLYLQQLELELSSIVYSLRSSNTSVSEKGQSRSSDDLLKLSDAWEFQENEILNAKDKLRSIRAKLAVVEGKMALKIIDAQKMIEEKQKRINCARRALQILSTASVVWPNSSASEVLLAGSFDGWTTQRKMEKSNTGFSLSLKLYPGRYEIKFIVDGQWKIDPLRPIVTSGGHENNLLIIT